MDNKRKFHLILIFISMSFYGIDAFASNCSSLRDYEMGQRNGLKMAPPCESKEVRNELLINDDASLFREYSLLLQRFNNSMKNSRVLDELILNYSRDSFRIINGCIIGYQVYMRNYIDKKTGKGVTLSVEEAERRQRVFVEIGRNFYAQGHINRSSSAEIEAINSAFRKIFFIKNIDGDMKISNSWHDWFNACGKAAVILTR